MTDRLETLLRETYASDAAQAPLAGDLADGARQRASATRRRHAAITASALAVTAAVVGAAVTFGPSTDQGTPEPAASTPAASVPASPTPFESALFGDVEMGSLSLRGVSVPVPAEWLIGASNDCPSKKDSAYIFRSPAKAPCSALPVPPNTFTTVRLALSPDPDTPAEDVTTRLEGGSTLVVRHLGDVVLRVISPDGDLARAIAASATVDGSPTPSPVPSGATGLLTLNGVSVFVPKEWMDLQRVVCGGNEDGSAAYLVDETPGGYCLRPEGADETFVLLGTLELARDEDATTLADGRTQVSRVFPDQQVSLIVRSPDADLAERLAAEAVVDDEPHAAPADWGVLSFGGVQVPVPADWLDPTHLRCGQAIEDAAYVAIGAVEACGVVPDHPERVSSAVLEPLSSPPPSARPGERTLADGRTQIWSGIPGDARLRLVVTSPDADLARRVFDGLVIVDRPDGCAMTMPAQPDAAGGGTLVPEGMIHGQICSYIGSQVGAPLGHTHTLTTDEAQQLSAALNAAPADERARDCVPVDPPSYDLSNAWVVTLSGPEGATATVVVGTDACGMSSAASTTGARSRVTAELMSALHHLAPGLYGMPDVVSDK